MIIDKIIAILDRRWKLETMKYNMKGQLTYAKIYSSILNHTFAIEWYLHFEIAHLKHFSLFRILNGEVECCQVTHVRGCSRLYDELMFTFLREIESGANRLVQPNLCVPRDCHILFLRETAKRSNIPEISYTEFIYLLIL